MTESKFSAVLNQREKEDKDTSVEKGKKRGPGRPRGKRTNPDYEQVTAYIPRSLHDKVKIALIESERKEFSQLVEELLARWLQEPSKGKP